MERLQRARYRRAFMSTNVGVQIAAQLHALRLSRNLSQEKLEEEIGMNQARISLMEKPDYQKYNIKTLKRFAEFYDVALDVRFVSIKDQVDRIINQSPEDMAPEPFEKPEQQPANLPDAQPAFESAQPQKPQREEDSNLSKVAKQFSRRIMRRTELGELAELAAE